MITGHHVTHGPFIVALTDHPVPPLTKVLVHESGIFAPLNFLLLFGIFAV